VKWGGEVDYSAKGWHSGVRGRVALGKICMREFGLMTIQFCGYFEGCIEGHGAMLRDTERSLTASHVENNRERYWLSN